MTSRIVMEGQLVDQMVYAKTRPLASFEWPEEARKRRDVYLAVKSYTIKDRVAAVEAIVGMIRNPGVSDA